MGCSQEPSNNYNIDYKIYKHILIDSDIKKIKDEKYVYLISVESIPNLIKIIEDSNILKYKNNSDDKMLGLIEKSLKDTLKYYKLEKKITLYNNLALCKDLAGGSNEKKNEFIIVELTFLIIMKIEIFSDCSVLIKWDEKKGRQVIFFPKEKLNLDFENKRKGIYEFKIIEDENKTINSKIVELEVNNLDKSFEIEKNIIIKKNTLNKNNNNNPISTFQNKENKEDKCEHLNNKNEIDNQINQTIVANNQINNQEDKILNQFYKIKRQNIVQSDKIEIKKNLDNNEFENNMNFNNNMDNNNNNQLDFNNNMDNNINNQLNFNNNMDNIINNNQLNFKNFPPEINNNNFNNVINNNFNNAINNNNDNNMNQNMIFNSMNNNMMNNTPNPNSIGMNVNIVNIVNGMNMGNNMVINNMTPNMNNNIMNNANMNENFAFQNMNNHQLLDQQQPPININNNFGNNINIFSMNNINDNNQMNNGIQGNINNFGQNLNNIPPNNISNQSIQMQIKHIDNNKKFYLYEIPKFNQPPLIGLANIGATCYMNATLQCLSNINLLTDFFLVNKEKFLNIPFNSQDKPISKAYSDVLFHLWNPNEPKKYYSPDYFKDIISSKNKLFQGIQANDSKDLLLFLYENIHKELNTAIVPKISNEVLSDQKNAEFELIQCRKNYFRENKSIITDLFYFDQTNITTCLSCGAKIYNFSMHNVLIFPLEKTRLLKVQNNNNNILSVNLKDCFDCHIYPERNQPGNQFYCNTCRQESDYLLENRISSYPEILTIVLNRGNHLEFDVNFTLSHLLDEMDNYLIQLNCNKEELGTKYRLIGIIIHTGNSGMDGHFFTYCRSPVDKKWYWFNDAIVTRINDPIEENRGIPYLLFYQKIRK